MWWDKRNENRKESFENTRYFCTFKIEQFAAVQTKMNFESFKLLSLFTSAILMKREIEACQIKITPSIAAVKFYRKE